jgi:hypothetical protein
MFDTWHEIVLIVITLMTLIIQLYVFYLISLHTPKNMYSYKFFLIFLLVSFFVGIFSALFSDNLQYKILDNGCYFYMYGRRNVTAVCASIFCCSRKGVLQLFFGGNLRYVGKWCLKNFDINICLIRVFQKLNFGHNVGKIQFYPDILKVKFHLKIY